MWEILGIEPTTDIKIIKSAYAKLAKQFNPEEHPEEFKRIFDAYKAASKFAKACKESGITISAETAVKEQAVQEPVVEKAEPAPEKIKDKFDFSSVSAEYGDESDGDISKLKKSMLMRFKKLTDSDVARRDAEVWSYYFSRDDFELFIYDAEFRKEASNCVFGRLFSPEAASVIASGFGRGSRAKPVNFHPVQEWKVEISEGMGKNAPKQSSLLPDYARSEFGPYAGAKEWLFLIIAVFGIVFLALAYSSRYDNREYYDSGEVYAETTAETFQMGDRYFYIDENGELREFEQRSD